MTITSIRPGDQLECNVRGREFTAVARGEAHNGTIQVEPLTRGITYRRVTARQVVRVLERAPVGSS